MRTAGLFIRAVAGTAALIGFGFSAYAAFALLVLTHDQVLLRAIGIPLFAAAAVAAAYAGLRAGRLGLQDRRTLAASGVFLALASNAVFFTFLAYHYLAVGVVLVMANLAGLAVRASTGAE